MESRWDIKTNATKNLEDIALSTQPTHHVCIFTVWFRPHSRYQVPNILFSNIIHCSFIIRDHIFARRPNSAASLGLAYVVHLVRYLKPQTNLFSRSMVARYIQPVTLCNSVRDTSVYYISLQHEDS